MSEQLDLFNGKYQCCGVLCPRAEAQKQIDKMQELINLMDKYFNQNFSAHEYEIMLVGLNELKREVADVAS